MATDKKEKSDKKGDEKILEIAKKRFKLAEEAYAEVREVALDDLKFRAGEQWPEALKRERKAEDRPCLTINRLPQFIRQVTNDQRQNRPSIKVHPVDDRADVETAKIYQGIIRNIEQSSGADVAYDTAFEGAAVKGFGFFRVNTQYIDPTSFDQEAAIEQIHDDFGVYLDPHHKKPDGSDASWGFIFADMPKDDFDSEFGESDLCSIENWEASPSYKDGWVSKDSVRVAEYFYKEFETKVVVQLADGLTADKEDLEKFYPEGIPDGLILNEKTAKVPVIKWLKINGHEVLDRTDWLGKWIPIIPVYGDRLLVDGRLILEGVIRHAKDSQRMLNYWKSSETEAITLAPKAPFIAAEGQIPKQYEAQWKTANRKTHAYLTYKPTTHQGQLVPAPQRNFGEPNVQAITQASLYAQEDLKATTGIYDSALGNRSNETSGIAIQRRNLQAQTSNFHLIDNLSRSIRHAGRILVDLIPKIYDAERAARIIGEEGEEEIVLINKEFERRGEVVHYKMGVGKYDVVVETGPSFATKREEASQTMLELSKSAPQVMGVASDLIVKNMDWPGAQEIAERLKKTLPPGIADDKDQKPIPPEVQAQMQQMGQMLDQLTQTANEQAEVINQKRMELESKERIEFAKLETQLQIEAAKLKSQEMFTPQGLQQLLGEIADINVRLQMLGINRPIDPNMGPAQPQNEQFLNGEALPDQFGQPIEQIQPTDGFSSGLNMEE